MATLDDKLLGEKSQYYYSSSEGEDEGSDREEEEEEEETPPGGPQAPEAQAPEHPEPSRDGLSVNTGPKGVMQDWRRFKQLQAEQQAAQRRELEQLVKRLSMTCRSQLDEERDRRREEAEAEQEQEEDFLERYRRQRMEEMRRRQQQQQQARGRRFGQLLELDSGQAFLDAVDGEAAHTLVLVHIYEDGVRGAEALHGCLACLAAEYPGLKVCQVRSSLLGTSARFTGAALPALLAYRARQLVGNFLRLTDQLGDDFYALDLEAFLRECGLLPDKEPAGPGGLGEEAAAGCQGEDSDLDID